MRDGGAAAAAMRGGEGVRQKWGDDGDTRQGGGAAAAGEQDYERAPTRYAARSAVTHPRRSPPHPRASAAATGVGSERATKAMRWGRGGRDLMLREADSSGCSHSHGYPAAARMKELATSAVRAGPSFARRAEASMRGSAAPPSLRRASSAPERDPAAAMAPLGPGGGRAPDPAAARGGREPWPAAARGGREAGGASKDGSRERERGGGGRGRTAAHCGHGGPLLLRREEGAAAMACLHRATARASTAPPWIRRGALDPGLVAAARREGGRGAVEGRGEEGLSEQRRRRGRRLGAPAGEEEGGGRAGGASREGEGGAAGKSGGGRENGREETGDHPRTRNFVEGGHATAVNARASVRMV
jgi:hypothetical protein